MCFYGSFLTQVTGQLMRRCVLLGLGLANTEELVGDVKVMQPLPQGLLDGRVRDPERSR